MFVRAMPPIDHEKLTHYALLTLEDVGERAHRGTVERAWGTRLALAWLNMKGVDRATCNEFWRLMSDQTCKQSSDHLANRCRGVEMFAVLSGIYREVGVKQTPEMAYMGKTGKRFVERWTRGQRWESEN